MAEDRLRGPLGKASEDVLSSATLLALLLAGCKTEADVIALNAHAVTALGGNAAQEAAEYLAVLLRYSIAHADVFVVDPTSIKARDRVPQILDLRDRDNKTKPAKNGTRWHAVEQTADWIQVANGRWLPKQFLKPVASTACEHVRRDDAVPGAGRLPHGA